jgi:replicative DNA helicase
MNNAQLINNETKLISKIIETRNLGSVLERGVTDDWFIDTQEKNIFRFMREHYLEYQETPSLDIIVENFPTYRLIPIDDSIDYFVDRLISSRRKTSIIKTVGEALTLIDISSNPDHEGALLAMERGIVRLEEEGLTRSNDLEITIAAKTAQEEYEHRKNNPGLLGIPTGFPTIDASTSGLQNGQLVVIVAPPKTGKSTLALQIAINCQLESKTPMFMSFEMSNTEQKNRYYSMRSKISYTRLMTGSLTDEEEARFLDKVKKIQEMEDRFYFVDSANGQTVSAVASKIQSKSPDIIFIDGTYLMIDEQTGESNTPQAITNITRSLKRLAQKVNRPIVISTQALAWKMKKGQVTTDSIGYSSSFHQDADVIFGLQRQEEASEDTRTLKVIASRNSGLSEVALTWDWNQGTFREMDENDL